MATANDITDGAYLLCRLKSPDSTQDTRALAALNRIIALWAVDGLMIPYLTEETFTLVQGTISYTIGSGGAFNTTRPTRVISAYLRDSANVDYPIDPTMSLDEYNRISDKTAQARPDRLYYAPEYTLGKIYFDAAPDAAYTLKLFSEKPLTTFATLATSMSLPAEYEEILVLTLAARIAPELGVQLDAIIISQAIAAQAALRNLNARPVGGAVHDTYITRELAR